MHKLTMIAGSLAVAALLAGCQTSAPMSSAAAAAKSTEPNTVTCNLKQLGTEYKGTCSIPCLVNALAIDIDGPNPKATCDTGQRTVAAMLRKTDRADHWLGTMEGKFPEDQTRFELLNGNTEATRVAKLPYGWFRLQSTQQNSDSLALTISANKQLPPNADDIKIIQRAIGLVANEGVWNKADNRQCPPNPQKWSVFCALTQATEEVSGGVHYRQPALQAVREVVNEVGGKRVDKHRLMDYNNHPDTTLDDIHNLLRMAQARLEKRFR